MDTGDCLLGRRTRTFPIDKRTQALQTSEVEIKGWEFPEREGILGSLGKVRSSRKLWAQEEVTGLEESRGTKIALSPE